MCTATADAKAVSALNSNDAAAAAQAIASAGSSGNTQAAAQAIAQAYSTGACQSFLPGFADYRCFVHVDLQDSQSESPSMARKQKPHA